MMTHLKNNYKSLGINTAIFQKKKKKDISVFISGWL